jgi:hypothetical protein
LRLLMFEYFNKAEAVLKTVCSYRFAMAHKDSPEAYLDRRSYRADAGYRKKIDMQAIEKLKTTDDLGEHGGGIWKKWPWKDSDHYELMSDLILKAKYSIQDFNSTIGGGFLPNPKDTVYLVALATWIKDASGKLKGTVFEKRSKTIFSSLNKVNSTTRANISKLFARQLLPTPSIQLDIKIMVLDQKEESALT